MSTTKNLTTEAPELVRANPERLHELFKEHGGFDRFREVIELPEWAAKLIWEDPDGVAVPRRRSYRLTLTHIAKIGDDLDIPWSDVVREIYGI